MSDLIFLSNVRLSFPHLAEPQKQQGENGERISYNAEFIMAPDHPGFAQFMQAVQALAVDKWKEQAGAVIQHVNQDRKKRCYGWGQEKVNQKTFKVYDGYEGNVFITAGRNQMPQMIDANGQAADPANTMACQAIARKLYGGCYVNAAVKPWLQENKHGRGIRCDLVAVQFFADGQPFGEGAVDASGLFGAAPQAAGAAMPGFMGPTTPAAPQWAAPQVSGAPVAAPAMPVPPFPQPGMPAAPFPAPGAPAGLPPFLQ